DEIIEAPLPVAPWPPPRLAAVLRARLHRRILQEELEERQRRRSEQALARPDLFRWRSPAVGPLFREVGRLQQWAEAAAAVARGAVAWMKPAWVQEEAEVAIPATAAAAEEEKDGEKQKQRQQDTTMKQKKKRRRRQRLPSAAAEAAAVLTRPYTFAQLELSPHVRTAGRALYHGVWAPSHGYGYYGGCGGYGGDVNGGTGRGGGSGSCGDSGSIDRSNDLLHPHGEGFAELLDGWGCATEEKTLYVTVFRAKDLPAMDRTMSMQSSDPFLTLRCNNRAWRTQTRYQTLTPTWNERWHVDVTNPAAVLVVECWDEDRLGSEFMGQATVPLAELKQKHATRLWLPLGPD
ncbi:unnamed protein product, partial [Phaeothamnion confervicola]